MPNTPTPQFLAHHTRILLDSFHHWTGDELIGRSGDTQRDAQLLDEAPFAVMSHGTEANPIINYGNRRALSLWQTDWEHFTGTPSQQTAEVDQRAVRAALLAQVSEQGFARGYTGVRISFRGLRFEIQDATVWNLIDEQGLRVGQAAWIPHWAFLDPREDISSAAKTR